MLFYMVENREAISTIILTSSNTQLVNSYIISDHLFFVIIYSITSCICAKREFRRNYRAKQAEIHRLADISFSFDIKRNSLQPSSVFVIRIF